MPDWLKKNTLKSATCVLDKKKKQKNYTNTKSSSL